MSRKWLLLAAGCLVGSVAVVVSFIASSSRPKPAESQPPEIGGQKAPSLVREIDFDKRYDAHCAFFEKEPTVFRGCKVVGFTGPANPGREPSGRGDYFSSSGGYYHHFDRWLVLELSDGRHAYIPPNALRYLETAKAQ
jgi:hypothetical protein